MEVSDKEMAAIGMDGDGMTSEGGDDVMRSEGNSDGVTSDEDDDIMASEGGGERQRVCYKHERAIPIESTVQDLDLREEGEWAGPGREMGMGSGGPGREMGMAWEGTEIGMGWEGPEREL